jgi:hypothetical protein
MLDDAISFHALSLHKLLHLEQEADHLGLRGDISTPKFLLIHKRNPKKVRPWIKSRR